MPGKYIMTIDQGTTSSTCLLFDEQLHIVDRSYREVRCFFPRPGWVSQNPAELWESTLHTMRNVMLSSGIDASDVVAIGITNQRETTVVWERATGKPIHEAIVWQCRRTAGIVQEYEDAGYAEPIADRTGLLLDAYFSASKLEWIMRNNSFARSMAERGELAFGTVDTWLLWNLTGGKVHATDPSNAARTMMYNIHDMAWDDELIKMLNVPKAVLPQVLPTVGQFGVTDKSLFGAEIPIFSMVGDQQAALFGQGCFRPGDAKNTYGTGCFLMMNTGRRAVKSRHKLVTTVAWQIGNRVQYALEGSMFSAGSSVKWLRDNMGLITSASDTEPLALSLSDNGGVYFVPALSGMGAPYWDQEAKGALYGLTGGTRVAHIARAVLEATAYQTRDVLEAMLQDSNQSMSSLRADGGMVANKFLMQFQSDIINLMVEIPSYAASPAKGAAALAGLGAGLFDMQYLADMQRVAEVYRPSMEASDRQAFYEGWKEAVRRTLTVNRNE